MKNCIKVGNAQAFWGDSRDAPARLLQQQPDLDYLTLDYLSEVSLSIMAIQKEKDPLLGYARDFLEVVKSLMPLWKQGATCKLIANAGGLNPIACAEACQQLLEGAMTIGVVTGDDVLPWLKCSGTDPLFANLDTNESLAAIQERLMTANAYLGAEPIVQALKGGAQIVITGRIADPSLTVAPCAYEFGWHWEEYDKLAGATIAGHLIECGTQATGGFSTRWLEWPDLTHIGFPVAEISEDGSCVITKPEGTGGAVNVTNITEQLLYEIGDPDKYLSPDVAVSFLGLHLEEIGKDRVRIAGARGFAPTDSYKVSATYRDGFRTEGTLLFFGEDCVQKAERCGQIILERTGYKLDRSLIECLGAGDAVPGVYANKEAKECVLRVAAADKREEALESFSRQFAPLITSGPQGVSGYTVARAPIRAVFGYWPCLIEKHRAVPAVEILCKKS